MNERRLARITVDVLLPAHYSLLDLSELMVEEVKVSLDGDGETLPDFVQATVVEAHLVMADQ